MWSFHRFFELQFALEFRLASPTQEKPKNLGCQNHEKDVKIFNITFL
jgi:hypothetical protein